MYELLDEKFHLFTGVFGVSDDVMGSLESGVDIERQILDIYQRCRTPEEIEKAFDTLREKLEGRIQSKIEETRRLLMEQFDAEVHRRLRLNLENVKIQIKRTEDLFWRLSKYILRAVADFSDEYTFILNKPPIPEAPSGKYTLISQSTDGINPQFLYRLSHSLGEYVLRKAKTVATPSACIRFHISDHPVKISQIEELVGCRGYLTIEQVLIKSADLEEYILVSGTCGADSSLSPEVAEKMWQVGAEVLPTAEELPVEKERLDHEAVRHRKAVVSASLERTHTKFEEEREKLNRWADDKVEAVERELTNVKAQIRSLQKESRNAETIDAQHAIEEKLQRLQKKKKRIRAHIFEVEDEIEAKRDELIDALEKRMNHEVHIEALFTESWEVV